MFTGLPQRSKSTAGSAHQTSRRRRARRRCSPRPLRLESLESRELLSVVPGWLRTVSGPAGYGATAPAATDLAGNVYVAGSCGNGASFGEVQVQTDGSYDAFVAKYTPSGSLASPGWLKTFGGPGTDDGQVVAVDNGDATRSGALYVCGTFKGTADFDPGIDHGGRDVLTSSGAGTTVDVFVLKLDLNGNFVWVAPVTSSSGDINFSARDLQLDAAGDVYVSGALASWNQGFLTKLHGSDAAFQWTHSTVVQPGGRGATLAVDDAGDWIYAAMRFESTATFDGQDWTSPGQGSLLARFSLSAGDVESAWTKAFDSQGSVMASDIAVDDTGAVYVGGNFTLTADLDPGPDQFFVTSTTFDGEREGFLLKLDSTGQFCYGLQFLGSAQVYSVMPDGHGKVLLGGNFTSYNSVLLPANSMDADPGPGECLLTTEDGGDSFLIQLELDGNFLDAMQLDTNLLNVRPDAGGTLYVTGTFNGPTTFPTGDTAEGYIYGSAFVLKMELSPIRVTADAALATSELGGTATFTVALTAAPSANVTIPLASSDPSEGTVTPSSLEFTPDNWRIPQTVTVTGVQDAGEPDGNVAYTILLGPTASGDRTFDQLRPTPVTVVNVDDDTRTAQFVAAGLPKTIADAKGKNASLTTTSLTVPAAGTLLDVDVALDITHPYDQDLNVYLVSPQGTRVELFTGVGGTGANFTGTTLDDEASRTIASAGAPFSGSFKPEGLLSALDGQRIAGTWKLEITDTHSGYAGTLNSWSLTLRYAPVAPGVTVTPTSGLTTTEAGGTATFTVVLNTQPDADVTIPLASSDTTEGTASPASLRFTRSNWYAPQTVTVRGVDDTLRDGDVVYKIELRPPQSPDGNYSALDPADVAVTNKDNEKSRGGTTLFGGDGEGEDGSSPQSDVHAKLLLEIPNPIPAQDNFGWGRAGMLAALGDDLLVGANRHRVVGIESGVVHLLDGATGSLLRTFDDPAPATGNLFGTSVATVGNRILISAPNVFDPTKPSPTWVGAAYLFDTNGVLVRTIPSPDMVNKFFGVAVAALGDKLVIGAPGKTNDAGAVHVFGQDGTLETTLANPEPGRYWQFGSKIVIDGDRLLIAAGDGAVYLFDSSGALLQTFHHPASDPGTNFGKAIAMADGRILIGAYDDSPTPSDAGAAYLFDAATGQLLQTIYAPAPVPGACFGESVAFHRGNLVIGAPGVTSDGLGVAYLMDPEGNVLASFANPAPSEMDRFGMGVLALGDKILLTAPGDDLVAPEAGGTLYLFDAVPDPNLGGITVSPASAITTDEAGTTSGAFSVVLDKPPATGSTVAVPLSSSQPGEGLLSSGTGPATTVTLTFDDTNWNVPQWVTVTGVNDTLPERNNAYRIEFQPALSEDLNYAGLRPAHAIRIDAVSLDNDGTITSFASTDVPKPLLDMRRGVIGVTTSALTVPTAGTLVDVDVHLGMYMAGFQDLTIYLISPSGTRVRLVGGMLDPRNLVGTVFDDEAVVPITSGDGWFQGRFRPEGSLSTMDGQPIAGAWKLEVQDAQADGYIGSIENWSLDLLYVPTPAGVTVTPTAGLVTTEARGTASFTVALNTRPTANVVIPVSSSDTTEGTVSISSLTFTPTNWYIAQKVTVKGVDDKLRDGDIAYSIVLSKAVSTDGAYGGLDPADVAVVNRDNETGTLASALEKGGLPHADARLQVLSASSLIVVLDSAGNDADDAPMTLWLGTAGSDQDASGAGIVVVLDDAWHIWLADAANNEVGARDKYEDGAFRPGLLLSALSSTLVGSSDNVLAVDAVFGADDLLDLFTGMADADWYVVRCVPPDR
jgi:subtilisin-like proprotein convertase family protein